MPWTSSLLKRSFERALIASGATRVSYRGRREQALILAYHNIVPSALSSSGDSSLHLAQQMFAKQLDVLTDSFDVVELSAVLSHAASTGRPRVAITFDDAYRGAVTAGVAELAARGLPATIFVAPAFLGGGSFWWDVLADRATGTLGEEARTRALQDLRGEDTRVRDWAVRAGKTLLEPDSHARAASEEELLAAARTPGVTLASHSWSHPNLARLTGEELEGELSRPLTWLRNRYPGVIPWISYPYGLSSPEVERRAAALGYEGGLRVSGGWMASTAGNRFALPRLNIPAGLSLEGFRIRMSGLFCS